jgi:hypothetical protein
MSFIYHLEVEAKYCEVTGIVNKLPMYELDGENPAIFSKPINAALIGKHNLINFLILPSELSKNTELGYGIKGAIKKYHNSDMTGPDQGEIVKTFSFQNIPTGIVEFDNEVFNYSSLLSKGMKIPDKGAIEPYAIKLKKLFQAGNTESILQEFKPKLDDYAVAYNTPPEELYSQFKDYLTTKYFPNNPILDFSDEEIFYRPWCEKRVWEIGIGPEFSEFVLTAPNDSGIEYATKLFVGLVDGKLKIVR